MKVKRTNKKIEHWQFISTALLLYDVVAIIASYFFALWFRFDCRYTAIPKEYLLKYSRYILIYTAICIFVFLIFHLYKSIWRFASYTELRRVIGATAVTFIVNLIGSYVLKVRMPISYFLFGIVFQFIAILGVRFLYRFLLLQKKHFAQTVNDSSKTRVLLVGAGEAGQMILRDIKASDETNDKVCCIVDDNSNKWGRYIDDVRVVGGRDSIMEAVEHYHIQKIVVAIPSASAEDKRDILNICKETGCELKNLPGMYQFVTGEIKATALKEVNVEDLLGRETIKVNMDEIFKYIEGKICMVTGGGGSIGSELCRQIAAHSPKQLIIFDVYENNAYDIQQELKKKHPTLNLVVLIGSVRDSKRIDEVFSKYKPDIVYHAAAHKHVPLMEDSPCESIKNNAIGTYKTAYAAMMNGCKKFVLISTDKAVNPTNIMGASKRVCEMIIQAFDKIIKSGEYDKLPLLYAHSDDEVCCSEEDRAFPEKIETEFVAVRFGNVLGSNGSVIPLFKKQIAQGGPVTVTHPDIIRYFMTIPEAVSLVMQAGVYAKGGEIFVLDMGAPVKIDTLARNLIKLSGLKPDEDIKIEYTGLRPGEKLFEEKLMSEEGMKKTPNDLIHIGSPIPFDELEFIEKLKLLMKTAYDNDEENIRKLVADTVKTYNPQNVNEYDCKTEAYKKMAQTVEN